MVIEGWIWAVLAMKVTGMMRMATRPIALILSSQNPSSCMMEHDMMHGPGVVYWRWLVGWIAMLASSELELGSTRRQQSDEVPPGFEIHSCG